MRVHFLFYSFVLFAIGSWLSGCKKSPSFDKAPLITVNASMTFNPQHPGFANQNQDVSYTDSFSNSVGNSNDYIKQYYQGRVILNVLFYGKYQPVGSSGYIDAQYSVSVLLSHTSGKLEKTTYSYDSTDLSSPGSTSDMTYQDPNGNGYTWGISTSSLPGAYASLPAHRATVTITNIYTENQSDGKTHTYADGSFHITYFGGPDGKTAGNGLSYIDGYPVADLGGNVDIAGSFAAFEVIDN